MKRSYKIALHVCYWLYMLGILKLLRLLLFEQQAVQLNELISPLSFSYLFVGLCVFYGNYLLLLPKFFKTRRFLQLWLCWLLLLGLGIFLRYSIEEMLYPQWLDIRNYNINTKISYYVFDNLYFIGIYIVMSTVFWTADFWIRSEKEKNILQEEKFNAEMSMLKSQVSPHFLFNTLNNIYSLAYRKSDKAPESILKLSGLMRYMLKDNSTGKVLLSQELNYVHDFIQLQQLRFSDPAVVLLSVSADNDDYLIDPLLLIPFIENGFKHGALSHQHPLIIHIIAAEHKLLLEVRNAKDNGNKEEGSGIGLQNVRKRLELLHPGNYTLDVQDEELEYICKLSINL